MNTPICDFLQTYAERNTTRLHMPGHKGLGDDTYRLDLTEIDGADSLYDARGIIRESEKNASELFGADTFYSVEGSSHSIRAMLYLTVIYAKSRGEAPIILAGRNAHKTFVGAAALLDIDVEWLTPDESSYLSCKPTRDSVEKYLAEAKKPPTAVYLTSPDYLGNLADVRGISEVCHRFGVLLLVDNAHGAYLKFLPESLHPIDLGADMCSDSAHKTLPVLTGGAYLHVSKSAPDAFRENAKNALALFGSTSPSYLILSSLDAANRYIADGYREKLSRFVTELEALKKELCSHGYIFSGDEPMKLTLATKSYGYLGHELAEYLSTRDLIPEFYDPDFVVLMLTPELDSGELARLKDALISLPKRKAILDLPPKICKPARSMSPRGAIMSGSETVPVSRSLGRVLASVTVGCPPAVPILVSGEIIDEAAIKCFDYYGITECSVVSSLSTKDKENELQP